MKKFKFIAFIFAIMTTMPILQSCLDDDDNSSDLLAISTINMISQDSKEFYFTLDDGKKMYPSNSQGWMKGAGKRVMVYSPKEQEPELMYKIYDFVSDSMFRINDEIKSGCSEKPNDQKADAGEICGNCDAYCECALGPNGAKHDNPACEYFDDSVLSQLNKNIHEK